MNPRMVLRAAHFSLFVAGCLLLAGRAGADSVNLAPSKDNTLIETPAGNSNGAGDAIYVGRVGNFGGGTSRRGLLAFNLSSIPAGSTIDVATLTLAMVQSPNGTARVVSLHRAGADWGEAGSSGQGTGDVAQTGDATWTSRFFNTASWTAAGGDFAAANSASQSVLDLGSYVWSDAGLVADLQFWLDHPASNFGWVLLGDESTTFTVKAFSSREGFTPPALSIEYTPSQAGVAPGHGTSVVSFASPWPAPARGRVNLGYALPRAASVSLSIEDAAGRVVRRLAASDSESPGPHSLVWDGQTESGAAAAPGVYLASLIVDGERYPRRFALLR